MQLRNGCRRFSALSEIQIKDEHENVMITHLIEDLEPLYRDSDWAMLIQVLKDVKLPTVKESSANSRRVDKEKNETLSSVVKEATIDKDVKNEDMHNLQQNAETAFETVLSLADIGVDMLKFLPNNASVQAHNVLKYFTFFRLIPEVEKSLKTDSSTKFLDTLSDILGAAFLNIVESTKQLDDPSKSESRQNINLCNAKEFQKIADSSDWNNIHAIQRYACGISRISKKMLDPSDAVDVEKLRLSLNKMKN
ncbi:ATP-binding cassette sub-family A member 1 [Caerostris extrusa]|uniref:ATP-binding cassette sub-family A member 1 n=1 Tax=Caerostris extrusa TaxID=172846 RepID=A0AAV4TWV3_CAEEX|nr:ATP-binding cassette sub-family A member 1 [Caerostris extrusa]